jgi:hypothetical protein
MHPYSPGSSPCGNAGDESGVSLASRNVGRCFLVLPLPHPFGAARWPNDPANRAWHAAALALLSEVRARRGL